MIAPSIAGAATSIKAFVGPLPQGPQQAPVAISDIADFERSFGPVASAGCWADRFRCFSPMAAPAPMSCARRRVCPAVSPVMATRRARPTSTASMWSKPSTFFACLRPPEDPEYFALYRQAAEYCEKRRALLLAEPPRDSTVADARGWIETIGVGLARRNVAAFYAGLLVAEAGGGEVTKVPCTGAVAGVLARNDATRGVWRTAAGTTATIAGSARARPRSERGRG
jgi:hypothetical protein